MHIPHELADEFPDEVTLIARLLKTNYLFRRTGGRYDAVNHQIFRIKSEEEPTPTKCSKGSRRSGSS